MDLRKIIKSRKLRGMLMDGLAFLPDAPYISLFYFAINGKFPDLRHPTGYNEKLQWLKLHNRRPEFTELADKIAVREHVEKVLGSGYTFPLLGVWENFDDIDFAKLPNEFVLKCNHDSGGIQIIRDKNAITEKGMAEYRRFFNACLKKNFYYAGREYPYKNIHRRIFAEQLMKPQDEASISINDYKFFCFNGVPKLLLVVSGRNTTRHIEDYFDMDFNHLSEIRNGWEPSKIPPEKPGCFEEMKQMAVKLSVGIPQVRMDFYEIDGKPYFGEYTFFSGGGFELFHPKEWERRLGDWIDLDNVKIMRRD